MTGNIRIPFYVLSTYKKLIEAGYEAFIVGGSVRDILMGRTAKDWDITTNATPEQIQAVFPETFYENIFGTVGVPYEVSDSLSESGKKSVVVEVTTYRSDGEYTDFRRPDKVEWGQSITEDLMRRDFTINAIAMNLKKELVTKVDDSLIDGALELTNADFILLDPYGGLLDLERKLIKAVGDPGTRFKEDALRMLRAVRFVAQLDFGMDPNTLDAIRENAKNIVKISGERIRDELWKILASDRAYEGIVMLDTVKLLVYILPELEAGREMAQKGHHVHDVFTHSLMALKFCPSKEPVVRLAALLHDIGKPIASEGEGEARTFYNHDIIGGKLVNQISHRLHLSKKDREKLYTLVRYHMFTVDTIQTDSAVRRFIRKVGADNINDMIDLRIGDRLGSGTRTAEGWRLKEFRKRIEELLMPTFTVKDLAINGNDLMKILNIPPGPKIGTTLNELFEEVLDDPQKNTREYLEKRAVEINS